MDRRATNGEKIIRFDIVSFILSFMVVMIHSSYTHFYPVSDGMRYFINEVYCDFLSGFAVPGFFLLSGIKFYKNYDYNQTGRKIKSRINSLLIPFLAWNIISVIWAIFLSYAPGVSSLVAVREKFSFSFANIIGGVLWFKFIHPFWFMAMLIIFTLACPLIFTLIKNEICGIICVIVLFSLHSFASFPETAWPMFQIETIVYSLCFYMIGGIVGRFYYDKVVVDPSKSQIVMALFEFPVAVLLRSFEIRALFIPSILLGLHSIWVLAGKLKISKCWWLSTTFFIFPAHTFVLPVVNKLISFVLPKSSIMVLINTMLGTIITFIFCIYLAKLTETILPRRICTVLNGGRDIRQ